MKNVETTTTDQNAAVAEQGAPVAPVKAPSKKGASQKKNAPKAKKSPKGAKAKAVLAKKEAKTPRRVRAEKGVSAERTNKKAEVIALMKRSKGVTLAEIVEATGWQRHTVRGFVSILGSQGGEKIESSKEPADGNARIASRRSFPRVSFHNAASGSGRGGVAAFGASS